MNNKELNKEAKKFMRIHWEERGMDIDKDCLCNTCPAVENCKWSWDLYNFGDCCLADK